MISGVLREGVRLIDHLLSESQKIMVISQDPECIFRIQLRQAGHSIMIGNLSIQKGDPILALHLWNEHMPVLPMHGANLEWALRLRMQLNYSLRLVAKHMMSDSRYADVRAMYGASTLLSFAGHTGGLQLMQHLGFTVLPYHGPFGRFGEFWENLFSWWLMWTYNAASLRSRAFSHLQRTEIWMPAEDFMRRFG